MMTFKTKLDKAGPGDINRKCQGLGSRWTQWSEVPLDSQHVWAEKSRPWLSGEQEPLFPFRTRVVPFPVTCLFTGWAWSTGGFWPFGAQWPADLHLKHSPSGFISRWMVKLP